MNTQISEEWFQDWQVHHMASSSHSLPDLSFEKTLDIVANITTPSRSADATSTSPKLPGLSSDGPKSSIVKPMRRRSRASRKAPTTLLNANTNNFRALVQQFTGCHSASPAFGPYYRGPINLNFSQYKYSGDEKSCQVENRRQLQNTRERTDQSFSSFENSNVFAAAGKDDEDMFVSGRDDRVHGNIPGGENALTFDDFDLENFPLQELTGDGDYSDVLHGNYRSDDFWGH